MSPPSPPLVTVYDAQRWVAARGLVTLTPDLVAAVAGETVRGSWWSHAAGSRIYHVAEALEHHPDVEVVKLVHGRLAYLDRRFWPDLARVVTDATWRSRAAAGLSPAAAELLAEVEIRGEVALTARHPGRAPLEKRVLVHGRSAHTERGHHATHLQSWVTWAASRGVELPGISLEQALAHLRALGATL